MEDYFIWVERYFKFRDSLKKEIKGIKKIKDGLVIYKEKSGVQKNELVTLDFDLTDTGSYSLIWILMPNTESSVKQIVAKWDFLCANDRIRIILVNPQDNKYWMLNPYSHAKVTESKKLLDGLIALYQNS